MPYLFITRLPPYEPLKGGELIYTRLLMQSLAEFHPVQGMAYAVPGVVPTPHPNLTWTLLPGSPDRPKWASLASPLPNVAFRNRSAAFLAAALAAARGADAVFVDFIAMFWLVPPLVKALRGAGSTVPVIVLDHNDELAVRRQMAAWERSPVMKGLLTLDAWKAGRLERQALLAADGLATNTEADRVALSRIKRMPGVPITPAFNGTRLEHRTIGPDTPRRICILGTHTAHHKKMVLTNALDALTRHGIERQCIVDVVGDGDHAELRTRYPGVNFLGWVEDAGAYMDTARIGLMPDEIGGGFKGRALTQAFRRLPILAVRKALLGMGFVAGETHVEVETVDDMARAIPGLLDDFALLNRVQEGAYAHCGQAYNWVDRGRDLHGLAQGLRAA